MIKTRIAEPCDLYHIPLTSKFQAEMRDAILTLPDCRSLFNCFTQTAYDSETGDILCVAGFLGDGEAWSFVSADFRDNRRDFATLARLVREGCQDFYQSTGCEPYSVPDREVPEAPRVAAAFGFEDMGGEKWALRQH